MDLFSFLATIILITSIVTLCVAVAAYLAYRIREMRKPMTGKEREPRTDEEPIFLKPSLTEEALAALRRKADGNNEREEPEGDLLPREPPVIEQKGNMN